MKRAGRPGSKALHLRQRRPRREFSSMAASAPATWR